jgi:hypothetical protein
VRILISYEDSHRVYSDALERALRGLRPGAEVASCSLGSLGRRIESFDPDLVVSSRPNNVDPGGRAAWYKLSNEPDEPSEACLGGRSWQRPNPTLEDLLSFIEEVETLVLRERDPNGC